MKPIRSHITIHGKHIDEYYWSGKYHTFVNNYQVSTETFDEIVNADIFRHSTDSRLSDYEQ